MMLDKSTMVIIEEFSHDYSKMRYGNDIAKKHKLNQKTEKFNSIKNTKKMVINE